MAAQNGTTYVEFDSRTVFPSKQRTTGSSSNRLVDTDVKLRFKK